MTIPTISTLPVAPARTDAPATFVTRADAFLAALVVMQGELNTSIGAMNTDIAQVNTDATAAAASATAAASSATAAANAAGAALWVSGQAYAEGDAAISLINYQTYRAETATSGTTDPSLDANWTAISASFPIQTGNADKFLQTDGTNTLWTEVSASPTLEATASGALANGDKVVINADGSVSVVSTTTSYSTNVGAKQQFSASQASYTSIAYDSNAQRVVITYMDAGNINYGTAIVGSISGDTISFGTPVVFESATVLDTSVVYDEANQKVVVFFKSASSQGAVVVGTVSGSSISFGSTAVWKSAGISHMATTYDSTSGKIFVVYRSDTEGAGQGQARLGTVSGTSISFGSQYYFETGSAVYFSAAYDSNSNKIVAAYTDEGDSDKGKAIVFEVSGTTLSSGVPVVFANAQTYWTSTAFDSNENKIVISYRDIGNSGKGTAIVGTVSGTSISFGTEVVFGNGIADFIESSYDPILQRIIVLWRDQASAWEGRFAVGTVSGTSISFGAETTFDTGNIPYIGVCYNEDVTAFFVSWWNVATDDGNAAKISLGTLVKNLTADNYIGISDAAYSDTTTAKIQINGSIDDAQSGLTAGQKYYVQNDNTLSTIPDNPSVYAGLAVSSTKLIVKG